MGVGTEEIVEVVSRRYPDKVDEEVMKEVGSLPVGVVWTALLEEESTRMSS